mgnify:CR=1 FL=1
MPKIPLNPKLLKIVRNDPMTDMKTALGIELGSTRIKAVAINENHVPVSSGDYTWKSSYENGVWTYDLAEVWKGLKTAVSGVENREAVKAMGVSAMMHGYLAFDKDWNLLVPFRTWRNPACGQAADHRIGFGAGKAQFHRTCAAHGKAADEVVLPFF